MATAADNTATGIDKYGIAPTFALRHRHAPTSSSSALYYLRNDNGINYGIPWLRATRRARIPSGLVAIDPKSYYGAASDYNAGGATYGTVDHMHRFDGGGELQTVAAPAAATTATSAPARSASARAATRPPACPTRAARTWRRRGRRSTARHRSSAARSNKVQDLHATYLQTDYSEPFTGLGGVQNEVLAGVDLAREEFQQLRR